MPRTEEVADPLANVVGRIDSETLRHSSEGVLSLLDFAESSDLTLSPWILSASTHQSIWMVT